ncbi:Ig-like domain-containing protein [Lederbergia panacisoli]|uniref:Ig-like domain-containing protein n=1 Tax=Lederbergia panacisoli TaxID=1255251 RepID=UPI00214B115F|nr:Ig-like domain-containing protein [Lederbergia panacisoli]MCR2821443.1 Ig-like domain-containing protein [Lederbergia panacisoli]
MGYVKKVLSMVLVLFLMVPTFAFAESSGVLKNESEMNFGKKLYIKPADYPLVKDGNIIDIFVEKYANQIYSLDSLRKENESELRLRLFYQSNEYYFKSGLATLEFYKDDRGSMAFLGSLNYDLYYKTEATIDSFIPISFYDGQEYVYVRIGIYEYEWNKEYFYTTTFKVKNPVYTAPKPDTTPPAKPAVNSVSDKDTKVTGTAEAGATVYVKSGSTTLGSAVATSNKKFTVAIKKQKAGTKLTVYAVDKAKNKGASATITVVDKTAPAMPTASKVSNKDKKVTGKAEAGSKVTVKAGSKILGTANTDKAGKYSVTMKAAQKAGTVLSITATDKAKNTSAVRKITVIDKIPPAAPKVNKVTIKSTAVKGKAEANSTVYVKVGSKVLASGKASKAGSFSIKIKKQKAGVVLQVYAKDKAGNVGKSTKVTVKTK